MADLALSGLNFYPVKSLRGIGLERAPVDARGIRYDRHWMLVDGDGGFLSQRRLAGMALVQTALTPGGLRLSAPGMPELDIPLEWDDGRMLEVKVWNDLVLARSAGSRPANWFSQYLDTDCRLVSFSERSHRAVDPEYAQLQDQVAFSDGFPFLLISEASLEDLNGRLDEPVPMKRFRPNLVVRGCEPYAEDSWSRIRIGEITFRVAKPCSRCVVTTIDPDTAEKGAEPLKTLRGYRRRDNKVYFGQNLLHDGIGELRLGAKVEVLEYREA
jgi:uncharacterized protein YcbX